MHLIAAPPEKLLISLFSDLKDVRLFFMVAVVVMMTMMIKRKKNLYQMLHSWPTWRPLLNSGCLSPHTALGKGMLASPCVLVQVSLLTVSLSLPPPPPTPLSQAEPFIFQESDAKNLSTVSPPGKPACFSFLTWSLALLTPSCLAAGIHSAKQCRMSLKGA